MLLLVPGLVVALAITFCCIYMIPLMTDRSLGLVAAIKESYAMARRGDWLDHVVVVLIFLAISMIGGSFFIGSLFTQPLATLFMLSVYEEKTRTAPPAATTPYP
jgi:membrane-anchored glycerophosphoryl diester phosphodiesterase (GDPDase)